MEYLIYVLMWAFLIGIISDQMETDSPVIFILMVITAPICVAIRLGGIFQAILIRISGG